MKREIFQEEHELFRTEFRRFAKAHVEPKVVEWNARGQSDKATWRAMGEAGYLGAAMPERGVASHIPFARPAKGVMVRGISLR